MLNLVEFFVYHLTATINRNPIKKTTTTTKQSQNWKIKKNELTVRPVLDTRKSPRPHSPTSVRTKERKKKTNEYCHRFGHAINRNEYIPEKQYIIQRTNGTEKMWIVIFSVCNMLRFFEGSIERCTSSNIVLLGGTWTYSINNKIMFIILFFLFINSYNRTLKPKHQHFVSNDAAAVIFSDFMCVCWTRLNHDKKEIFFLYAQRDIMLHLTMYRANVCITFNFCTNK